MATGESTRWAAFAAALNQITSKPVGSESALIKTTKAHVEKLVHRQTIRLLQSQVIREKAGDLKASGKLRIR
jgi:hypothetical protein